MPTQELGTTLITRVCFHTSTKALASLFGACPNSLQMKRNILHYRTLLYQKQDVWFKMPTSLPCPLCQQADSAIHTLSGRQHTIISGMITDCHHVACRLMIKAICKGSLAGCLVHAGSTNRLAQQNLQFPEHASNRTPPSWLFNACLSARDTLTSRCPDAILVTPLPTTNPNRQPLLIYARCHTQDNPPEMYAESTSSMSTRGRYTLLKSNTVKICGLDTIRGL